MKTSSIAPIALAAMASAQDMSICDKYTTALLKDNTAANQETLLTLVVNTAVIGNYTTPNHNAVPGILAPGTGQFEGVNLLPYFSGGLASTNNGGSMGVSMNFLDGGGATPLENNKPADDTTSAQYTLLTHLYEYFAYLLGCSEFGNTTSPYAGSTNMYEVHKYMALDNAEVEYFITQVGLSAASFGVSESDVNTVGMALKNAFGYRCSAPASIPASAPKEPQAICIASDCPLATNAVCSDYAAVVQPSTVSMSASSSMATASGYSSATMSMAMGSSMPSSTGSSMPPAYTGAASLPVISGFAAAAIGALAFFL